MALLLAEVIFDVVEIVLRDKPRKCWRYRQRERCLFFTCQSLDRYKYPERFGELNQNQHRDHAVQFFLTPLEGALRLNYLGGALPCVTDIAIFPFVRQFSAVEPLWFKGLPLPAVQAWLAAWLSSQLF